MRNVRIGTTAFLVEDTAHTPEMNVSRAIQYVGVAKQGDADIVCLPEMVTTANVHKELEYHAEDYPGAYTETFQRAARDHAINIIAPYLVRAGGRIYNQATVIDRKGNIAGFYRKVQLTAEESRHIAPIPPVRPRREIRPKCQSPS